MTVLSSALNPRVVWNGAQGLSASFSATQEGELGGRALRGAVAVTGRGAADVQLDQAQRAAERGVGLEGRPEAAHPAVRADLARDRPVEQHHHRVRVCGGVDATDVELLAPDALHRRDEGGEHARLAARHHGADRGRLDRGLTAARCEHTEHVERVAVAVLQHRLDALLGRRDHGEAVGPVAERELAAQRLLVRGHVEHDALTAEAARGRGAARPVGAGAVAAGVGLGEGLDQLAGDGLRLRDHRVGVQPADRVRDDDVAQVAQPALLSLQVQQIDEGGRRDVDGRDTELFEDEGGVDTPRGAGPSVAGSD